MNKHAPTPVDFDDHAAILAYGVDAIDAGLDPSIGSTLGQSPVAGMVAALKDIEQALQTDDLAALRKGVGFIGRLIGEDIEQEARARELRSRMGVLLANAQSHAEALLAYATELAGLQARTAQARQALSACIDAGRAQLDGDPQAGRSADRVIAPRDHFEHRLQHLAAVAGNHLTSARQLELVQSQVESLLVRHARIRDVLAPALRQKRQAMAQDMQAAVDTLHASPWPAATEISRQHPSKGASTMNENVEGTPGLPSTQVLDPSTLQSLGLGAGDLPRIDEIGKSLQDITPGNLHVFAADAANKTAAFSTQLLDQVRNRDLEASGEKLGEVVRIARTLNLDKFGGRSKVPLLGGLIDRFKASKGELVQKFSTTNQQIEHLMRDVGQVQADMGRRVRDFDRMHEVVVEERHELGLHAAAGKIRLKGLEVERQALEGREDPDSRTQRAEIDNAMRLLDKRVGDLVVMQHAAEQTLPMIRIIQANAIQLIEKFNSIRDITIPSWRRHFAIQLSLDEQKNAVELSNSIDDANNELMRKNADLVHATSVATAKANQRAAIDIETLRHVHDKLISTVEEVRNIHREGIESRKQAELEIARMRDDVQQRLASPTHATG